MILRREEVAAAVERREGCPRPPVFLGDWWGMGLSDRYGKELDLLSRQFPNDILGLWYQTPGNDRSPTANPEYRFGFKDYRHAERHSIGETAVLLEDWSELDAFLSHFPDPHEAGNFAHIQQAASQGRAEKRYMAGCWWRLFHEFFWNVRGMENLMMDYYDNMDGLKAIGQKAVEFYRVIIQKYADMGCSCIFTSDDLGHQHGPMMSPTVFHELYFPLYKEVISYTHSLGLHFFLHSCGDNSLLLEDLIASGLDVLHPIQKGCMDLAQTVEQSGSQLSFLVGMDVQNTLVNGTPEEVREELRDSKGLFANQKGGLLLAMGNGILPDTPIANIRAAMEEMHAE